MTERKEDVSIFERCPYIARVSYIPGRPWNLGVVDRKKNILRGAAAVKGIDPRQSLSWLKEQGINTIIILNRTEQGISLEQEIELINDLKLQYHCFDWETMLAQKNNGRECQWKEYVAETDQGNCFIHCVWGVDRTGATVARLRREIYDWPAEHAFEELRAYGFAFEAEPEDLQPYQKDVLSFFNFDLRHYQPLPKGHPDHTACLMRDQTAIG